MVAPLRSGLAAAVMLAFCVQVAWANFATVERGGGSTNCDPVIAPDVLGEDALCFCDRTHEYNDVPAALVGIQYLMVSNDDKTTADYQLTVSLDQDGVVLLFIDDRVGDDDNTTPPTLGGGVMDWVVDLGFVDTGMDVGIDESGDGTINQTSSVFELAVSAGETVLLQQDDGGSRNMYGVACRVATPGNGAEVPAATLPALMTLTVVLLGAGALLLRRRPALGA